MNRQSRRQYKSLRELKYMYPLWSRFVAGLAAVVLFCTVYSLILPAAAVTGDNATEKEGFYFEKGQTGTEEAAEETVAEAAATEYVSGDSADNSAAEGTEPGSAELTIAETGSDQQTDTEAGSPEQEAAAARDMQQEAAEAETGKTAEAETKESSSSGSGATAETETGKAAEPGAEETTPAETAETAQAEIEETTSAEAAQADETTSAEDAETAPEDSSLEDESLAAEEEETAGEFEDGRLEAKSDSYHITLTYKAAAKIPAGAKLDVRELEQESAEYDDLSRQIGEEKPELGNNSDHEEGKASSRVTRLFDIRIIVDGGEIEPSDTVEVNIQLPELKAVENQSDVTLLHFDDGVQEVAAELEAETLTFETDSFSVYGVVYQVEFRFELNGETYEYAIPGGGSVSLRELMKEFGVSEEDVTAYMDHVSSVTSGAPELIFACRTDRDAAVRDLLDENELRVTYPLGLTQEEVLALNGKEYAAGEWVLLSLKPFDTEETITVAMDNGDEFTITVTDAQDAVMVGDQVQTVSNPAGTTIDLFDYWIVSQDLVGRDGWGDLNQGEGWSDDSRGLNGSGNNKGINSSTDDSEHGHALKFSPAWEGTVYNGIKIGTSGTEWSSVNGNGKSGLNSYTGSATPFQGIVEGQLSRGYPVLTNYSNHGEPDIGSNGESLAYLFDPTVVHNGKASYSGVNQLLYVDKDGYYTYDSRDYAAQLNTESKTFTLTEQTSSDGEIRGFWPFGTQKFWSGMHINTQFSMPVDGQVLNPKGEYKDMQFEFSGDDDTWLYVDGVLVGDGGGIHNRTEIDINFAEGKVIVTGEKDSAHGSSFHQERYLDDIFREAEKYNEDDWEDIGDGSGHKRFKAGTYHTFDMFYLERGGGESNLYIHYNLVSTADFTAHKSYAGADQDDILRRNQFKFELVGLDGKYRSVKNAETGAYELVQEDTTSKAIMPRATEGGEGTVESPYYNGSTTTQTSAGNIGSQTYITGVTEDGNVNFGSAEISEADMRDADQGNPPVYKYIIREIVPDDAVNGSGTRWADATDEEKAAGGFKKDQITYDGTIHYMTARVTSWTETDASGREVVRYGLSKTYYTDDTYTTVKADTNFINFDNRFVPEYGNVDFKKVDGSGAPLQGAEFALYKDAECTVPALDLDTEGTPAWTATSDSEGTVAFQNVRTGTYYMKETVAPTDYALDETIYKVVIINAADSTKTSKITVNGDESETEVTEITNAKPGKITVVKKWLNSAGEETDGGSNAVTVQLRRRHLVPEHPPVSHTVNVQMSVEDGGRQYGPQITRSVTGDTIVIEWDDEWQRNFNWTLTVGDKHYEGWIGDETVIGDGYKFEQISVEGRSRRLTIYNAEGDITLSTQYWVSWLHSDPNHWNNLNSPVITSSAEDESYIAEEDAAFNAEKHTQLLRNASDWSHTWSIGGTPSDHAGYDFPAADENGKYYLYYVAELDADGNPLDIGEGIEDVYYLQGYSPNNSTGVSSQGVLTLFNQLVEKGYLRLNKVVKYDEHDPGTAQEREALAGEYTFNIYSDAELLNLVRTVILTIGTDGRPKASDPIQLPTGEYWIEEMPVEGKPIYPMEDNPRAVTITTSGTVDQPVEFTVTNDYYVNSEEDTYTIDIEKRFEGLTEADIPAGFQMVLQYQIPNTSGGMTTREIVLHKDLRGIQEDGIVATFEKSNDGTTWVWHLMDIPADAVNFKIKEENYGKTGYRDSTFRLVRTEQTSTEVEVQNPGEFINVNMEGPENADFNEVTNEKRYTSDNNTAFWIDEGTVLLVSLTGAHSGTAVISLTALNNIERDAIKNSIPLEQGSFAQPVSFYSIEQHPDSIVPLNDRKITVKEENGRKYVTMKKSGSSMEGVFEVTYNGEPAFNNEVFINKYTEGVEIDITKVDDETIDQETKTALPDAVFRITQLSETTTPAHIIYLTNDEDDLVYQEDSAPTDENGHTGFDDLRTGFYEIKELHAPTGYIILHNAIYMHVDHGEVYYLQMPESEEAKNTPITEWAATTSGDGVRFSGVTEDNATADFTVGNTPGAALPSTGGPGTRLFTILGLAMMLGAAVMLFRGRRLI